MDKGLFLTDVRVESAQIQATLRYVGLRQRWLWSYAMLIMILLALVVASFAFPGLLRQPDPFYSLNLNQSVRVLVGLVLIFNVYAVYQQWQIHRLQDELSRQIATLDGVAARSEEIYKIALLDPLTGLYNRRSGEQRLSEEVSRSQRHGLALTAVMLDLDGLKEVNDTLGHAAGDELIKYFARRVANAIRGSDLAVRMGGDEFLLVLPECKPDEVRHVLGRLDGMKMNLDGRETPLNFSVGWANYVPDESPEELLRRADKTLYENKRSRQDQRRATTSQTV